jgi:phosphoadenosine phosphosulfate reductase
MIADRQTDPPLETAFKPHLQNGFCAASPRDFEGATAEEILRWAVETYGDLLAISTGFQLEGMVILDMATRISPDIRVFTVDTGRLPDETHRMIETVRNRYGISVEIVSPDAGEVSAMVSRFGPNLFYSDVALRMSCCEVRKVRPFERKIAELKAYAVGLRRDQTSKRSNVQKVDMTGTAVKLSPLADWTKLQVEEYTRQHNVPIHPLYAKGYTSIGCAPCTRAIEPGESERDGRWWWERGSQKECGLHLTPNTRAEAAGFVRVQEILGADSRINASA